MGRSLEKDLNGAILGMLGEKGAAKTDSAKAKPDEGAKKSTRGIPSVIQDVYEAYMNELESDAMEFE